MPAIKYAEGNKRFGAMIKIRRIFGFMVVTGTPHEITRVQALSGVELSPGDKVTLLPYRYHIHRNPGYPGILKYLEDQGGDAGLEITINKPMFTGLTGPDNTGGDDDDKKL